MISSEHMSDGICMLGCLTIFNLNLPTLILLRCHSKTKVLNQYKVSTGSGVIFTFKSKRKDSDLFLYSEKLIMKSIEL